MTEMQMTNYPVAKMDMTVYAARLQADNAAGRCFICEIVRGEDRPPRPIIYRDEICIAFPNRYQRVLGYTLLAPIDHLTSVVSDFSEHEYIQIQQRIHRIGRAIIEVVPTERLYIFSFGSNQGVAHVHWHLAPCPPGVPFERQQVEAVGTPNYYDLTEAETAELATKITGAIPH